MTAETTQWLALRWVYAGGMEMFESKYFNTRRPVADFLEVALIKLISSGLLALGRTDPLGWQHVCVTHLGQARYAELQA